MEIKIQSVGFNADEKLTTYIENKLNKMEKYNDRIHMVNVFLKLENSGQIKDKIVEIKAHIPRNHSLFVTDSQKTFESAFDKALDAFKRQVKKQNEILKERRFTGQV